MVLNGCCWFYFILFFLLNLLCLWRHYICFLKYSFAHVLLAKLYIMRRIIYGRNVLKYYDLIFLSYGPALYVTHVVQTPYWCFVFVRTVSNLRMSDPALKRVVSDIIRSPEDKREYRGLEFTNSLKAILISDPTTDKSSAALDVHIGKGEKGLRISSLSLRCKFSLS